MYVGQLLACSFVPASVNYSGDSCHGSAMERLVSDALRLKQLVAHRLSSSHRHPGDPLKRCDVGWCRVQTRYMPLLLKIGPPEVICGVTRLRPSGIYLKQIRLSRIPEFLPLCHRPPKGLAFPRVNPFRSIRPHLTKGVGWKKGGEAGRGTHSNSLAQGAGVVLGRRRPAIRTG